MADEKAWNMEVPGDRERETLLGSGPPVGSGGGSSTLRGRRFQRWWPIALVGCASVVLVAAVLINLLQRPGSPEQLLADATTALVDGHLDEARTFLQGLRDSSGSLDHLTQPQRAGYHVHAAALLRARQDRAGQGWQRVNAERIITHLESAQAVGWTSTPADLESLALAHVALGEPAGAESAIEALVQGHADDPQTPARALQARLSLARFMESHPEADSDRRLRAFRSLRDDPLASPRDMAQAAAAIAWVHLDRGDPGEAAMGLHRDLRRLEGRGGPPSPALLVLLGRAYRDQQRPDGAESPLRAALALAGGPDPIRGDAMVLLGDVASDHGEFEVARQWYADAITEYPAAGCVLPAIMGRGCMADALHDPDGALRDFEEVVRRLKRGDSHQDVDPSVMESRLLSRFESALTHGATEHALALAMLAASLRTPETRDARVSTALAVSASQVAHERTAAARATEQGLDDPVWQDIRSLHLVAGEAYLAASEAHQSVGGDPEAWARTLFQGGVQLDLAGHLSEASMVFRDYINARDEDDPIRVDAMFRLAQALEAEAVFDEASQWYEQVIAGHPGSLPATRSYMPSARCLVAMGDDELARCRLRSVVDGETPLQPGAGDYRDSLVMLGRLAAREAAWSEAASRLREAADRWPSHPQTRSILFEVASAQRALALSIDDRLATQPLSPSARQELEADRLANLFEAAAVFQRVAEDLQDAATTSSWDLRMRRAAAVSRADCLFESGQRQEAIAGYEAVARTWPDHPAAMHALVQVASAWTMLGDYERADAAHQRALARLESMPDSALETHDGFMSRAVWERWMDTMPVGRDLFAGVDPDP